MGEKQALALFVMAIVGFLGAACYFSCERVPNRFFRLLAISWAAANILPGFIALWITGVLG